MPPVTLLYVPVPSKKVGELVASALLKKKLIACANIVGPTVSLYRWKRKDEQTEEHILLLKTTKKAEKKARMLIEKLHPYECPCVLSFTAKANSAFEEWLQSEVKG